ncbi:MAG: hypothetical protein J6B61_01990 [Romboutsia sp.]|nr:hypothetical protein [Romboutsia sp.]
MFEKKTPFPWKIPLLILTGILVLSSGIYIGVKTSNNGNDNDLNIKEVSTEKETVKNVFKLNENCEIWLKKNSSGGSNSESSLVMLGSIPSDLLNKTKEEITAYLNEKYPDREIESITQYEIVLSEKEVYNDISKKNKYSLEVSNQYIGIYKYDSKGQREVIEDTQIKIDSLPQLAQEEIQKGILVDSEDEAYSKLGELSS